MPRVKQNIPANENEAQKFVRLANHRVNTILSSLKALGKLSGKQYTSTAEQRKKIEATLTDAVARTIQALTKGEAPQDFKL